MNGTETIVDAGPYPYTSPHDGNAHRIRALFHRPAGSGRPASGAPGAWRRRGSHLHQSRPHRHDPRPPWPSPPCAKATPWSCRNSTGRAGPSRMRAPPPISFGNEARHWPSDGRSTARAIRWERCSSITSPPSPSSKPVSSACAPARAWPSPAPGGNCAASNPNCPTGSRGNSAACMPAASIPSAISPKSSPSQDQPSMAHSTGAIPLSVRLCPYRNRPLKGEPALVDSSSLRPGGKASYYSAV